MSGDVEYTFVKDRIANAYGIMAYESKTKYVVIAMPLQLSCIDVKRMIECFNTDKISMQQFLDYLLGEGCI